MCDGWCYSGFMLFASFCIFVPHRATSSTQTHTHTHTRENQNLVSGTRQLPHDLNPRILEKSRKGWERRKMRKESNSEKNHVEGHLPSRCQHMAEPEEAQQFVSISIPQNYPSICHIPKGTAMAWRSNKVPRRKIVWLRGSCFKSLANNSLPQQENIAQRLHNHGPVVYQRHLMALCSACCNALAIHVAKR